MDSSSSRFVAALLSQNPGSEVTQSVPGCTRVQLALVPVKQDVVLLEATHPTLLLQQVKEAVASAKRGVPLHIVVANVREVDVASVLKAQIRPALFQMRAMAGVSWEPGQAPTAVRNNLLPQLAAAAKLANSTASLSLEAVKEESHREADVVRGFLLAVMQRKPVASWTIAGRAWESLRCRCSVATSSR